MSTLEIGLPAKGDSKARGVQKMIDKNIPDALKVGKCAATDECNIDHSKGCNGSRNKELLHTSLDTDQECEDTSPDISLSSQKTLRYCDVEPEAEEHDHSRESSDSLETLEERSKEDCFTEISQSISQKLPLAQHVSRSSMGSLKNPESPCTDQGSSVSSGDHQEAIPEFSNAPRPESLSLLLPHQDKEQEHKKSDAHSKKHINRKNRNESDMRIKNSSKMSQPENIQDQDAQHVESDVCLSQNLPQGTITRKGDMIQFVADDLMEKIKKSSPMSLADTASNGSRRSSVRSTASASSSTSFATSSGVSRSLSSLCQQSPDDIPPIDASAVIDLENHSRRVADSLDLMMGNIRNNLHKMSAITIGCQDAYKRSVDITCDSVDASIKSMYALMAKCEELNSTMKPVEQLALQIEIKRILDLFEAQMTDK